MTPVSRERGKFFDAQREKEAQAKNAYLLQLQMIAKAAPGFPVAVIPPPASTPLPGQGPPLPGFVDTRGGLPGGVPWGVNASGGGGTTATKEAGQGQRGISIEPAWMSAAKAAGTYVEPPGMAAALAGADAAVAPAAAAAGVTPEMAAKFALKPGEWLCPADGVDGKPPCLNVNFHFRTECNRCGTAKPTAGGVSGASTELQDPDAAAKAHAEIMAAAEASAAAKTPEQIAHAARLTKAAGMAGAAALAQVKNAHTYIRTPAAVCVYQFHKHMSLRLILKQTQPIMMPGIMMTGAGVPMGGAAAMGMMPRVHVPYGNQVMLAQRLPVLAQRLPVPAQRLPVPAQRQPVPAQRLPVPAQRLNGYPCLLNGCPCLLNGCPCLLNG